MALPAKLVPEPPPRPNSRWTTVLTLDELEALRGAWDRLAARAAAGAHADACLDARGGRARCIAARGCACSPCGADRQLAAVAPLVEVTRGGGRWLEFAGSFQLYEPMRLLADPTKSRAMRCAARSSRKQLPLRLQRLDRGRVAGCVARAARGRAVRARGEEPSVPARRHRRRLRGLCAAAVERTRRRRCAASVASSRRPGDGRVRNRCEPDAAQRSTLCCARRSRWSRAAGKARAAARCSAAAGIVRILPRARRALRAPSGALLVRRLRVGDADRGGTRRIVVRANRCYELKIGYDEKFSRQSPGLLLTLDCLRDGFAARIPGARIPRVRRDLAGAFRDRRSGNCAMSRSIHSRVPGLSWLGVDAADVVARPAACGSARCRGRTRVAGSAAVLRALRQRIAGWRGRWFDWRNRVEPTRASRSRTCRTSTHASRVTRCTTRPRRYRNSSARSASSVRAPMVSRSSIWARARAAC